MNDFVSLLPYILPPILGAIIGYVTNYIAIKMLFRPLTEKRVFGIRVPFTPGIIPKQRYSLADSLGSMVSNQLLTEESVRMHLEKSNFASDLNQGIASFTEKFLDTVPGQARTKELKGFVESFEDTLETVLKKFVRSEGFEGIIESVAVEIARTFSEIKISSLTRDHRRVKIIVQRFIRRLLSDEVRDHLSEKATQWVTDILKQNEPVGFFITPEIRNKLVGALDIIYDPVLDSIIKWLNRPDVRSELSIRGKTLLSDILEKLNVFQRFIISAGQYDRTLNERMPEIIDDMIWSLHSAGLDVKNREKVLDGIADALDKISKQGLADLTFKAGVNPQEKITQLVNGIVKWANGPVVRRRISEGVSKIARENADRSVGDLLNQYLELDEKMISGRLSRMMIRWLHKPETSAGLSSRIIRLISDFLDQLEHIPVRQAIGIDQERKASIDNFLSRQMYGIIDSGLSDVLKTFNVEKMVVDKVNGLDIKNVEDLLLTVIAKHLRWINVFGALLGFIIGSMQLVFGLFS